MFYRHLSFFFTYRRTKKEQFLAENVFCRVGTTEFWKLVHNKERDTAPVAASPAGLESFGAICAYTGWPCMACEQQRLSKTSCLAHLMETMRVRYRVLDNPCCSSTICRQLTVCRIWRAVPFSQVFYFSNSNMNWRAKKRTFEGYLLYKFHTRCMEFVQHLFAVRGLFSFSRFGISKLGQASFYLEQ